MAVHSLAKSHGERQVLSDVDLDLPTGGVTRLVGVNEAGKSMLLSVMARLLRADAGTVEVGGLNIVTAPRCQLATVLPVPKQDDRPAVRLTMRDLMRFGRYPHNRGRPIERDETIVDQALEWMDLTELADRYLNEMSGGQRQRTFVAMVLAQETPYMLLDEPLNNLDMVHSVAMVRRLRTAVYELERMVVVIMHDINMAAAWSDRIVAMRKGRVVPQGTPEEIMTRECLSEIFGMDVPVYEIDGRRIALIWGRYSSGDRFTTVPGVLEALGVAELNRGDLVQGVSDLGRKLQVVC